MDEQYDIPTRRPLFSVSSIIISTIPIVVMIVGVIKLLLTGNTDSEAVDTGAKILLHLVFCCLGAPFAGVIGILAPYIAKERGERIGICKAARVYAKVVLFASLAFLAGLAVYSFLK